MKKVLTFLIVFGAFLSCGKVFAADMMDEAHVQTTSSYTNYKDCIRLYKLPPQKLFFLALSSVNANKYEIVEIQSRSGYILFKANGKELLLDVLKKDKNFSYIKLTPADNSYYFSPTIPTKIFNYIDLHFNSEVKELKF